jgi:hypothetical protein
MCGGRYLLRWVDLKPSDSSSDSDDEVLEIIEVSADDEVEEFLEFKLVVEVEPVIDLVGLGEVDFEDLETDKSRKKPRLEGYNNDTSYASSDYESRSHW